MICDAGKANWLHGLAGRIWMSTVVQWMALCYQEEGSPLERFGQNLFALWTNGYYRKLMREVGFENVQGRLLLPFGMASRFRGHKPND